MNEKNKFITVGEHKKRYKNPHDWMSVFETLVIYDYIKGFLFVDGYIFYNLGIDRLKTKMIGTKQPQIEITFTKYKKIGK